MTTIANRLEIVLAVATLGAMNACQRGSPWIPARNSGMKVPTKPISSSQKWSFDRPRSSCRPVIFGNQ